MWTFSENIYGVIGIALFKEGVELKKEFQASNHKKLNVAVHQS